METYPLKLYKKIIFCNTKILSKHNILKEFGINKASGLQYCKKWGYFEHLHFAFLFFRFPNSVEKIKKITYQFFYPLIIKHNILLENIQIKKLIQNRSYKGFRHLLGYPIRGQRTHSNAQTQKKNFFKKLDDNLKQDYQTLLSYLQTPKKKKQKQKQKKR